MADSYNILVVEDQTNIWEDLTDFFEPEIDDGILTLDFAATAKEGLKKVSLGSKRTDLIIIDVILPDTSNNELYFIDSLDNQVKKEPNKPKGILVSAHKSIYTLKKIASEKDWIVSAFIKPLSRKILRRAVQKSLNLSSETKTYASISKEINQNVLQEIRQEADIIKLQMKRSAADIIDAGRRLHAIKKKLPHGYFRKWIATELGCHFTTAANLMRVADVFRESEEEIVEMKVAPSILYFLAAPSTPLGVREKVFEVIKDEGKISYAQTKQVFEDYKKGQDNNPITNQANFRANKQTSLEKGTEQTIYSPKGKEPVENKQQILKVIRQQPEEVLTPKSTNEQNQWQKLGDHWLFNGYPDSESFRKYLPESVSLTIAFPNSFEWSKDKIIPSQTKSISIFFSPFRDLDLQVLKELVKNAVELCTEENEIIVFSFLPEPELILVVESLGCRCIIAEPDPQQCKNILSMWQS